MDTHDLRRPPIRKGKQSPSKTLHTNEEFDEESLNEDYVVEDCSDCESSISPSKMTTLEHSFETQCLVQDPVSSKNSKIKNENIKLSKIKQKNTDSYVKTAIINCQNGGNNLYQMCKKVFPLFPLIIFTMLGIVVAWHFPFPFSFFSQPHFDEPEELNALSVTEALKKSFDKQSEHDWKVIRLALKQVLENPQPKAPAVIMLLSYSNASEISQCLADSIARKISNNPIRINGKDYEEKDSNLVKHNIDLFIKNKFSNDTVNVCVVKFVNSIPSHAALIFHNYCDDGTANFKNAIFVFTVVGQEENMALVSNGFIDKVANKWLKNAWKDLDEDQLYPLLSRITPSVVAVVAHDVLPDICQK